MKLRKRVLYPLLMVALISIILLSATGVAFAQATQQYDMKCWGIISNGGGVRTSNAYLMLDSFGQQFTGASQSPSYQLRAGYVQERPVAPTPPQYDNKLYLPIAETAVALGVCSW